MKKILKCTSLNFNTIFTQTEAKREREKAYIGIKVRVKAFVRFSKTGIKANEERKKKQGGFFVTL